jgi:hypothetical protein
MMIGFAKVCPSQRMKTVSARYWPSILTAEYGRMRFGCQENCKRWWDFHSATTQKKRQPFEAAKFKAVPAVKKISSNQIYACQSVHYSVQDGFAQRGY